MQKVLINLSTLKKNPNAGNTVTHINMGSEFNCTTNAPLPEWLLKEAYGWQKLEWQEGKENEGVKKIVIYDHTLIDKFYEYAASLKGTKYTIQAEQKFNRNTIHHSPEPKYKYQYENPLLECSGCGAVIHVEDIVRDCYDDTEDGYTSYEECPNCGERDCFDYEWETVEEGLKRLDEALLNGKV